MKIKNLTLIALSVIIAVFSSVVFASCGEKPDEPEIEIPYNAFYDAENWEYMTNSSGASLDSGEKPVSLKDGSMRFFRANQAYKLGDNSDGTISFLLKATNDFSIWLNSDGKDNSRNSSYRLIHTNNKLGLYVSTAPDSTAAVINSDYTPAEWNRFDITFSSDGNKTRISVAVNGNAAELTEKSVANTSVEDNALIHTMTPGFSMGEYFAVKVWNADDYLQLKPVYLQETPDVPVVAAIGDSITEGAGAENFYTDSYPSQLQAMLGGEYNVINFGMSGRTARTDMQSYDSNPIGWIDNRQFLGVKVLKPDIAIVKLGTNDSKTSNKPATDSKNFRSAFENIISQLKTINGKMKIYVCTSATAYGPAYDINNDNIENIIIPVQLEVAIDYGCPVIDIHEYTKNKSKLFPDTIHPNTEGYKMLAEIFAKVILEGENGLTEDFIDNINSKYDD